MSEISSDNVGAKVKLEQELIPAEDGNSTRVMVMLHGLGDTAVTWRRILSGDDAAPVPAGWRLYALDMPGTGASAARACWRVAWSKRACDSSRLVPAAGISTAT